MSELLIVCELVLGRVLIRDTLLAVLHLQGEFDGDSRRLAVAGGDSITQMRETVVSYTILVYVSIEF